MKAKPLTAVNGPMEKCINVIPESSILRKMLTDKRNRGNIVWSGGVERHFVIFDPKFHFTLKGNIFSGFGRKRKLLAFTS